MDDEFLYTGPRKFWRQNYQRANLPPPAARPQEPSISPLLAQIDAMLRTASPTTRMATYRNILLTFCSSTPEKLWNRKYFLMWAEANGIANRLFPETPTKTRDVLVLRALDAMVLDARLRQEGFAGLDDASLARGFDGFVIPERMRSDVFFIWDDEKVSSTWRMVQNLHNAQGLHWTTVKDFADTAARKGEDEKKQEAEDRPAKKKRTIANDAPTPESIDTYRQAASIYREMFHLPSEWTPSQVASYVLSYHQKRRRIPGSKTEPFPTPRVYTTVHEPTGIRIVASTAGGDTKRYAVATDVVDHLRSGNRDVDEENGMSREVMDFLRRNSHRLRSDDGQFTAVLDGDHVQILLHLFAEKEETPWCEPARRFVESREYRNLLEYLYGTDVE
jgi:hypothetical protein